MIDSIVVLPWNFRGFQAWSRFETEARRLLNRSPMTKDTALRVTLSLLLLLLAGCASASPQEDPTDNGGEAWRRRRDAGADAATTPDTGTAPTPDASATPDAGPAPD